MPSLAETNISDWLIILATIAGPVLAVQAQKWIERSRRKIDQRQWVFGTLMTTRGNRLSRDHVDALNTITLAFNDGGPRLRGAKCQQVLDRWKEYLSHLSDRTALATPDATAAHNSATNERFLNLLDAISKERGFAIDRVELEKGGYHPQGMVDAGSMGDAVMWNALQVLSGKQVLRIDTGEFVNAAPVGQSPQSGPSLPALPGQAQP